MSKPEEMDLESFNEMVAQTMDELVEVLPEIPNTTKKTKEWTKLQMRQAVAEVRRTGASVRSVALKYNVPRSTLLDNSRNKRGKHEKGTDQRTLFSRDEERFIREWVENLSASGYPIGEKQLVLSAKLLARLLKKPNDGKAGRGWVKGFLRRNPTIMSHMHGYANGAAQ